MKHSLIKEITHAHPFRKRHTILIGVIKSGTNAKWTHLKNALMYSTSSGSFDIFIKMTISWTPDVLGHIEQ